MRFILAAPASDPVSSRIESSLLVFPDDEGRKAAWNRFRDDPEWLKLKAIPEYADKEIVSRITNIVLAPAADSEI